MCRKGRKAIKTRMIDRYDRHIVKETMKYTCSGKRIRNGKNLRGREEFKRHEIENRNHT